MSTGRPFLHSALLYATPAGYLAATVPFVRGGLKRGEPVLVAVPPDNGDLLRAALGRAADRVRFLDMTEAGRNPDRIIPWVLRAFVDEYASRRVRVIGEPIWPGRAPEEVPVGIRYEALINWAFAGSAATILCPYDAGRLEPGIVGFAARTHPVIDEDTGRRASTAYTEPDLVIAQLNQPLPKPQAPTRDLVFDTYGLRAVRRLTGEQAERAGLRPDRVGDLQVAVNEIATGTILRGAGPGTFRIWPERDRVLCEVHGPGEVKDWLAGHHRLADATPQGRSLLLANRLCDLVQTYTAPTGTTTRLHMRL
jgi:hypothetical protein